MNYCLIKDVYGTNFIYNNIKHQNNNNIINKTYEPLVPIGNYASFPSPSNDSMNPIRNFANESNEPNEPKVPKDSSNPFGNFAPSIGNFANEPLVPIENFASSIKEKYDKLNIQKKQIKVKINKINNNINNLNNKIKNNKIKNNKKIEIIKVPKGSEKSENMKHLMKNSKLSQDNELIYNIIYGLLLLLLIDLYVQIGKHIYN
jgi:hypothetical protein